MRLRVEEFGHFEGRVCEQSAQLANPARRMRVETRHNAQHAVARLPELVQRHLVDTVQHEKRHFVGKKSRRSAGSTLHGCVKQVETSQTVCVKEEHDSRPLLHSHRACKQRPRVVLLTTEQVGCA